MESVNEIKEALSARSRTATLDELRSEGRKRVRLIRAEHIAAMIAEAVHAAIEQSGLIAPEEAERLVEKSRAEFRTILQEREREVQHAHDNEVALAAREAELAELQQHLGEAAAALAGTRAELEQLRRDYADLCGQLEASRQAAAAAAAVPVAAPAAPAPAPASAGPSTDLLLSLVSEMATLKANLLNQQAQERAPVAAAGGTDVSAAIEKLAGSLNDRLEKLGRKMGVSGAVESDAPVDFGGMFKDTGKELESNMQNIEVKQKAGGGIAANLARLKKLKGGGR